MAKRFGFGEALPLAQGISGSAGTLPGETDLQNPAEVANLSFGQGLLTASPLQVTRMMAAAANGGVLVQPRLVLGTTPDGQTGQTLERDADVPSRQILSPEIAAQIQAFLIHCVMVEEEQHALPGNVSAGGKTATAQTGRFDENGDELEHGWFSGFFPAENPRYVVTVLAENSGFGNDTAAPVFAIPPPRFLPKLPRKFRPEGGNRLCVGKFINWSCFSLAFFVGKVYDRINLIFNGREKQETREVFLCPDFLSRPFPGTGR